MEISNHLSRNPYTVTFKDLRTGKLRELTRRPGEKLHTMLPTDVVELSTKKNADWQQGDEATIRHVSPRQPNTLQLEKANGETTFVSASSVELVEEVVSRGEPRIDNVRASRYLLWP